MGGSGAAAGVEHGEKLRVHGRLAA